MSSHREAPEISKDPTADNTDVYAFVCPDDPGKVCLIANFLPFELPYAGPNFYEFSKHVLYEIKIANSGHGRPDITFQFRFDTEIRNKETFLYNTGPIDSPMSPNWNRPQTYSVTRIDHSYGKDRKRATTTLGSGLYSPPANVGVHSTPNYPAIAAKANYDLGHGYMVFAGQRADAFHVDLGSIFDLGDLRPFQGAYNNGIPPVLANMPGVNGLRDLNVHTIALKLPITALTADGSRPTDVFGANSTIGVWASASRAHSLVFDNDTGRYRNFGSEQQVSRLGNPLVNEVLIPMAKKDYWNSVQPHEDAQFAKYFQHPELATLISKVLYPAAFPNLAKYVDAGKPRADLAAILLTGIPKGIVPGFQNYTGPVQADMLRLNVAVPPTPVDKQNPIGLVAGDAAGFPNGRRVGDDVTAIELKAVAGATIPLVDPSYTPDAAAAALNDGTTDDNRPYGDSFRKMFPYLSNPNNGFTSRPGTPGGELAG